MAVTMNKSYDLIVIGAGSIGVPVAMEFAKKGKSVLVIDSLSSPGQGQDKKAIGGVRATHSDRGKILVCQRSIEIFSHWKELYGDDIQWKSNGYSFPAYTEKDEDMLRGLIKIQQSFGLNIRWLSREEYRELNPGISMKGLRGSTYSPEDGSASPLLFTQSCYFRAVEYGAKNFYFYQNTEGQVVFCLTPDPPVWGIDNRATSVFLPMIARRMIRIMPMLVNLKVRRTWRGQYPNTPDGFPIVAKMKELDNFYQAVGMCGQGFMLGPGTAELLCRLMTDTYDSDDAEVLKSFDPYRDFGDQEMFK